MLNTAELTGRPQSFVHERSIVTIIRAICINGAGDRRLGRGYRIGCREGIFEALLESISVGRTPPSLVCIV
jgi:hypothetical protein